MNTSETPAAPALDAPPLRVEVGLWTAVALLSVLPALLTPGAIVGDGVDAYGSHWFYAWMRICLENLGDPSSTNLFFYPLGKDHFAHTGNNLVDALASVPFQWVLGPTLYQPVFIVALLLLNGLAFRALAREVLGHGFAAFAATLLWQVNPFTTFELSAGRPTQAAQWFAPLAVVLFLRVTRHARLRDGAWLGVAIALTGWLYWFNAYFLVFVLTALGPFALRDAASPEGPGARRFFAALALGALVCAIVVAPAVLPMAQAIRAGSVPGTAEAHLDNNVAPWLHGSWLSEGFGTPVLLQPACGGAILVAALRRDVDLPGGKRRWLVAAGLLGLLSLGPALTTRTELLVTLPWYGFLQAHLPFFVRLWFPYRMEAMVLLTMTPLVGAMVARARRPNIVLAALVATTLAGGAVTGVWPYTQHDMRSPRLMVNLRAHGGAMMFLPFRVQHDGIAWQTEFRLPMLGGMGESAPVFWPRGYKELLGNGLVRALRAAVLDTAKAPPPSPTARDSFTNLGYRWVVLRPSLVQAEVRKLAEMDAHKAFEPTDTLDAIDRISDVIGERPVASDIDVILWDLRRTYRPSPEHVYDEADALRLVDADAMRTRVERAMQRLGRSMPGPEAKR